MSSQTQRRSRSLSPVPTSRPHVPSRSRSLERPLEESFFDDDDDDDWIFDPMIDDVLNESHKRPHDEAFSDEEDLQYGSGVMLDFELRPVGARRNWKNVLNKQRYEATLKQHRDATPTDNLGEELTQDLLRAIERQIEEDNTLTPDSTVHFTLQSTAFRHAFQSTTFTVREFEDGSERLNTYLQSLAAKLNSNEEFTPDDTFTMETTFIRTPGPGSGHGKRYKLNPAKLPQGVSPKNHASPSKTKTSCVVRGPSSP